MPMVKYWKHKDKCSAKITTAEDGSIIMKMEGEDYPFPTFPRGHLLFGYLSKLKHEIKNQIFNNAWGLLEKGISETTIYKHWEMIDKLPEYDSIYGLGAGIFTNHIGNAMKFAQRVQSGNVMINWTPLWRADLMPYGGLKYSGFGKEGPRYAVREMTDLKTVVFHGLE